MTEKGDVDELLSEINNSLKSLNAENMVNLFLRSWGLGVKAVGLLQKL